MRRCVRWTGFGVVLLALAALAVYLRSPLFWNRYTRALAVPSAAVPAWYEPRERVVGGNQPLAPRVAPDLESLDPRALEEAAAYCAAHRARALIVARHDHIVFERYWQGTTFDTLSDAGGFTRVLAALTVGTAISHRRIGWPDEPIGYLLGPWSHDPRGAITVRDLLQSSSGLAPAAGRAPWSSGARWLFGTELAGQTLAERLTGLPGRTWSPQPADAQLLALALEHATGQRYASYLSEALWRRLGAADAWLYLDHAGGLAHADCCMLARQGDWIRVGQLLVRDGNYRGAEIIRPGWVRLMSLPARANPAYGAQLRLTAAAAGGKVKYAAPDTFAVDGGGGNRLWLVPSLGIAILRTGGAAADWDEARTPNLIVQGARDFHPARDISSLVPGH
jgi:CubicO group peptidase (beta-lactamase class C family)